MIYNGLFVLFSVLFLIQLRPFKPHFYAISALLYVHFFTCFLCNVKAQSNFGSTLADSAFVLTKTRVVYDPAYRSIPYPMGDVPANTGVCTDVVIRAYRKLGIDLQQLVHEDMRDHFSLYPKKWGLSRPDKNIDHRRVPNLMVFSSVLAHPYPFLIILKIFNPETLSVGN